MEKKNEKIANMARKTKQFAPIIPKKKSKINARVRCNLRVLLALRELNIGECADRAELSPVTVSALFNNKWTAVSRQTIVRLCHALNCSPGELFTYDPTPND